jgi:hypothetical protein
MAILAIVTPAACNGAPAVSPTGPTSEGVAPQLAKRTITGSVWVDGGTQASSALRSDRVLSLADGSAMTRDSVIKAVRGAQRVAGIEQGVHIFRHTFCSVWR